MYLSGEAASLSQPITWVDRKGMRSLLRSAPSEWRNPSFSPDGRHLAVDIDTPADISLIDLARDALTKLTFNPEADQRAVWTPDSSRIVYSSVYRSKTLNLHWVRADGSSAEPERLAESNNVQFAGSWHPRGRILAFTEIRAETSSSDLMTLEIEGDESAGWKIGQPKVFLGTTSNESEPMFSPDGNWIAYQSNQGSTVDVYVRPFPGPGAVTPISTDGGLMPVWSRTRRELLYRTQDSRMMVVSYSTDGGSFHPDKPKPWSDPPVLVLQRPGQRSFDLHPDGESHCRCLRDRSGVGERRYGGHHRELFRRAEAPRADEVTGAVSCLLDNRPQGLLLESRLTRIPRLPSDALARYRSPASPLPPSSSQPAAGQINSETDCTRRCEEGYTAKLSH